MLARRIALPPETFPDMLTFANFFGLTVEQQQV